MTIKQNFAAYARLYFNLKYSLPAIIVVIFLFPKIALASAISPERLIELTNDIRAENGQEILSTNPLLSEAAEKKAEALFAAQAFEHNIGDRRFSAWIKDAGYNYECAGENLAIDFQTSEGVVDAWMNSETHRRNILNSRFKEIGIAAVKGDYKGEETIIIAQEFGAPLKVAGAMAENKNIPDTSETVDQKIKNLVYMLSGNNALEPLKLTSDIFFAVSIIILYILYFLNFMAWLAREKPQLATLEK